MRSSIAIRGLVALAIPTFSNAFAIPPIFSSVATAPSSTTSTGTAADEASAASKKKTVAVTGATGRTGSLVVNELINRGNKVVALVRDEQKARDNFVSYLNTATPFKIIQCDLGSEAEIVSAVSGNKCDAAIWCATGFSDNPDQTFWGKVAGVFGVAVTPQKSIDAVGVPALSKAFDVDESAESDEGVTPKVIMLSSAGVTRPSWDEDKKKKFEGCADIPIVRLNPFGILGIKADSEQRLRDSGVPYCIFRPTGLNDKWPSNSRPIFSQGDVAVGRINREDVAKILVDCIDTPEATGKTFEAFSIGAENYPPAPSISAALGRLRLDADGEMSMDALEASYSAMQQLLPGEKQDAAALAMGQTYEELDEGKTGRLGERGSENAEAAAPKPSS